MKGLCRVFGHNFGFHSIFFNLYLSEKTISVIREKCRRCKLVIYKDVNFSNLGDNHEIY